MIEIEYKYVIDFETVGKDFLSSMVSGSAGYSMNDMSQLYLPAGGRCRRLIPIDGKNKTVYEFTYKDKLLSAGNLEVNTVVDEEFFNLANTIATTRLNKYRITFYTENFKWEIDYFYDEAGEYLCLMECEVESADIIPNILELPTVVRDNIILSTKLDDNNFTSKKLAVRGFAEITLQKVMNNEYSK